MSQAMPQSHYDCPCMEKCPLHHAMQLIGGKWKVQILCAVANAGAIRYNALRSKLDGISNTVLASALRELERDGLVTRREYLEVPVRVEYGPTDSCRALLPILESSATGQRPGCELSIGQIPEFVCKIHHFSQIAAGIIEQIAGFLYQCPLQSCHNPV